MIVRVAGLLMNEGHLLTLHYLYAGQNRYNLPGGKQEPGESASQTLQRELLEELAIHAQIGALVAVAETLVAHRHVLHLLFLATTEQTPRINKDQTSAQALVWLPTSVLATAPLYPNLGPSLQSWLSDGGEKPGYLGLISQPWIAASP
ncbi:MAG: NUDIX hydrolase [Magnetococcus sp. WYHC-3]